MSQTPAWEGYRRFTVTRKVPESATVTSFYLVPEDGSELGSYRPGQHIGIKLDVPGQFIPVMRSYTLSDSPAERGHYRLSIKREPAPTDDPGQSPGVSSNFMHDHVAEGSTVELSAPGGDFVLRPEGKEPVVLLSGGVGCTPMISMLAAINDVGAARDVWFIHGVKNGVEHAFGDFVRSLATERPNIHAHIRYSQPGADDVLGRDFDSTGHVDMDLLRQLLPGPTPQFYLCGATPFMTSLYQGLTEWGVDPFQINYEFFGQASDLTGKAGLDDGESHQVTFRRSGVTVKWTPAVGSLLELAETHGISPDFVCRAGNCHTCVQHVVEGAFSYLHEAIIPPMDDSDVLICSAKPDSDLVLDF